MCVDSRPRLSERRHAAYLCSKRSGVKGDGESGSLDHGSEIPGVLNGVP